MRISDLIRQYRRQNGYSMRDFATKCGVSHSYIAMLENEKNSKTGEPIIPSLPMYNKIALGLEISLNELISICDDMPVTLSKEPNKKLSQTENGLSEGEREWLELYRKLSPDVRDTFAALIEMFDELPDGVRQMLYASMSAAITSQNKKEP